MPIEGDTLRAAAQTFCDWVNRVLNTTVTEARLQILEVQDTPHVQFTFRQAGRAITVPLRTRFGPMRLYLGQIFDSERTPEGRHRLFTIAYRYGVIPEGGRDFLLRWEYTRTLPPGKVHCRHHLQGIVEFPLPVGPASLDAFHLPTGYVPFEDVLRFCIVDLGVQPLTDEWDATLRASYDRFKSDLVL